MALAKGLFVSLRVRQSRDGWILLGYAKAFGIQTTVATDGGNQRRVVNVDMGTRMAREGNLPKISHANHNPTQHVTAVVNSALGDIQKKSYGGQLIHKSRD